MISDDIIDNFARAAVKCIVRSGSYVFRAARRVQLGRKHQRQACVNQV